MPCLVLSLVSQPMPTACRAVTLALNARVGAVGRDPTPRARAVTSRFDALVVDVSDGFAVAREEGLGRAHLGAQRQLAFGEAVGTILCVFFGRVMHFRPARTKGAFVHLPARAEIAHLRVFRRAELARVETINATH